jgi:dipeptidyl aminopeptidase/acylaminoacyl peptidase
MQSSGCDSLFVKQDTLIEVGNSGTSSEEGVTAEVEITSYTELFEGNLLAYNPEDETAVLTNRTVNDEGLTVNSLSTYQNGSILSLYETSGLSATYSEAEIDSSTDDIYFKERDSDDSSYALFWSNIQADAKVRLTDDIYQSYLAWDLSDDGFLVFVNEDNHIMLGTADEQVDIYSLPSSYVIKKIAYVPDENFILLLASTDQTSNVLYRLNLDSDDEELSAIDVNVTDFVVSEQKEATAYIKTTSSGEDQLYLYDHQTYLRTYICSNYMEKISFSTNGNYIAFATKATTEIPTQSIWIVGYNSTDPVQIAADTKLSGKIFWSEDETSILFTTSDTTNTQTDTDTTYTTYQLTFQFQYTMN